MPRAVNSGFLGEYLAFVYMMIGVRPDADADLRSRPFHPLDRLPTTHTS
jgi:hypothetical protein